MFVTSKSWQEMRFNKLHNFYLHIIFMISQKKNRNHINYMGKLAISLL